MIPRIVLNSILFVLLEICLWGIVHALEKSIGIRNTLFRDIRLSKRASKLLHKNPPRIGFWRDTPKDIILNVALPLCILSYLYIPFWIICFISVNTMDFFRITVAICYFGAALYMFIFCTINWVLKKCMGVREIVSAEETLVERHGELSKHFMQRHQVSEDITDEKALDLACESIEKLPKCDDISVQNTLAGVASFLGDLLVARYHAQWQQRTVGKRIEANIINISNLPPYPLYYYVQQCWMTRDDTELRKTYLFAVKNGKRAEK